MASVCGGDLTGIQSLIENEATDEWVRGAALSSLVTLVTAGQKNRDEIVSYFAGLFRGTLVRCWSHVWDTLVSYSSDLYPEELLDDIEHAYEEGLVDPGYIGFDDVKRDLALLQLESLPEGVVDLATNRPPADVLLIASKANLVVHSDLHPALQYLLLRAAMEVHAGAGIFQRAGEFPAPEVTDLPISDYAARLYKSGPSILQRTLPFWLAELVQRLLIIVLPLAGIVYPLWSLILKMYRWQMQQRIIRLYSELRAVDRAMRGDASTEGRARILARINELGQRALELRMPKSFTAMGFNLRTHIRALRQRFETGTT
jgi:hypothetical protein